MLDIKQILDHLMINYSPGDKVDINRIVKELKTLGKNNRDESIEDAWWFAIR